ncbi:Ribosomal protein L3, bacterial/organelle-type [Candidatus Omnitrophus magneticus]|uniref:Large ribosomal subunit protein uL3 n=1 Tax=Candidatus Omnitrophus magneticus TaxID=1609969 RepID=A0A0F0CSA7_9BACT|nr:Ribosomal protein L3, bacterial/organelle-type [Candidatus Omnitrophus magneticus]
MITGILGKKIGMTQNFDENGTRQTITILKVGPCTLQEIKTKEKHGYSAVQLGFDETKESRIKKPQLGTLKKNGVAPKKFNKEIRIVQDFTEKVGEAISVKMFQIGDFVDIIGTSKGKGFQGGVKRHGWRGGCETHGSMSHRAPGSIGASSFPSRVTKGHPGPGHMGNERVTVQNIKVMDIIPDENILAVKGSIPGANGGYVVVKFAKKKTIAPRQKKTEETAQE